MVLSPAIHTLIDLALEEDLGRGDITSESIFDEKTQARAVILAKGAIVLSGLDIAAAVFSRVMPTIQIQLLCHDGQAVSRGTRVLLVSGPVRGLLMAERTALNFLQRLSGIATLTQSFVAAIAGTEATVVDTRKTAPGFRFLDKRAVRHGGGQNHRADLGSGVLIKDNHIAAAGSVTAAIERARRAAPHTLRLEVEVTSLAELAEALAARADVVLLDNMTPEQVRAALAVLPPRGQPNRPLIEVSGNIDLSTIRSYAETGVDLISVGALTHSIKAADLSLEIEIAPASTAA